MYALTTNESTKKAALKLAKNGEKITQKRAKELIAKFSDHVDVEIATNSPQLEKFTAAGESKSAWSIES